MSKLPEHEASSWIAAAGATLTLPKLWPVVPTCDLTQVKGSHSVRTKLNEHHSGNCNGGLSSTTQSSNFRVFAASIARGLLEPLSINEKIEKSLIVKLKRWHEFILFSYGLYVQARFGHSSECFLKPLALLGFIQSSRRSSAFRTLYRGKPVSLEIFPFVPLQSCATRHYSVANMGKTNSVYRTATPVSTG